MTSSPPFKFAHRITYSECAIGDHVYYSRYLEILEEARGELFRTAGCPLRVWQEGGVAFPVIGLTIDYKGPARYDDLVTSELWISEQSGIRLTFGFRIRNEAGGLLVEGETRHVCANTEGRPRRLPPEIVERLQPFVSVAA